MDEQMTHTPGPWRLEPVNDRSINHLCPVDANDMSLLTVVMHDETPFAAVYNDADACLIAAAPELLEALMDTLDFVERNSNRWDGVNGKHPFAVVEAARAAIAKATGATPSQPGEGAA